MAGRVGKKGAVNSAVKPARRSLRKSQFAISQIELEAVFNSITHLIMILGSDYRIKWANKATATFLNLPMSKITGKYCYTLMHGTDIPPKSCPLAKMMKSKKHEEAELYIAEKKIWAQVSADPQFDKKGNFVSVVHTVYDVTKHKQAEEALKASEAQYRLLADNTVDGIWLLDMNLKLTYCSPSSEKQSGFTLQEITEMSLEQYFKPESLKVVVEAFLEEIPKAEADPDYNPILTLDLEFYKKDGTAFWAESKFSIIRDKRGKPESILAVARDITERRKAEEALRESEAQYRLLSEHTTDTVWLMDMDLKTTYTSPSSEKLLGFTQQELMEMPLEKYLTPDSLRLAAETFFKEMPRVEADPDYNPVYTMELEYYCKDGTTLWAENKFNLIRDENGKPLSIIGETRDITERRRAEDALRVSESQYRLLSENITDVVLLLDMNLKFIYVSPSVEKMRGFTSLEAMELPLEKHLTPESLKLAAELFLKEMPGTQADPGYNPVPILDLEYYCKDGTTKWGEGKFSIIRDSSGKPVSILGEVRDITERLQAEDALRQSEVKYRTVLEQMEEAYYEVDLAGNLTFFNDATCRQLGYSMEELTGMNYRVYTSKDDMQRVYEIFSQVYRTGKPNTEFPVCRIRKDGARIFTENSALTLRNKDGKIIGFRGVARDVTKRLQAENALRASEAQYRLLSEHMTDTIRLMDMDLKTTYLSPSAEKQRGFTHQEMLELPLEKQLTPESLKVAIGIFSGELTRVKADPDYNPVHTLDLEYICKDGTTVWAESKFSIIRDENCKPVSILAEARDITDRRLAEDNLTKSYESLKKTLNDAINTMVKIVEIRDPYTAGHQQKVADLATAIARAMKLEDSQINQIRTAAVIHDIGKMYVPSDILSKPGKLSTIEFSLIKTHSQSGYNIVKGMDFPCSIADAVLQHHERLDGSGYPRGLKGEDTILEAKILAVADVIEAMASHRPYRSALGIDKALEEISNNRGKLYDPDVVDTCLELFRNNQFEFRPV